jgi:hypothetical protein
LRFNPSFRAKQVAIILLICAACIGGMFAGPASVGGALPVPLLPADNWWNLDISAAPVDPGSALFISFIGSSKGLHPDWGAEESPGSVAVYGFPYIVVDGSQPIQTVTFQYGNESDGVDHTTGRSFPFYPIPDEAKTQPHWVEGGQPGNVDLRSQDRHILIVDRDNRYLYELWNTYFDGTRWLAGSGAFFDLKTNNRRPEGWTSSDAAGLAVLPGLVRYDEVYGPDEIRHAFRATVRATNGYVYPASHRAGSTPQALPLGARLRLKAGVDISRFQPASQKLFRAMKRYGLIIADNGSDMYVSGTYDSRWTNGGFNADFRALTANDFEVVQLGYQPTAQTYFPQLAIGQGYTTAFTLSNTGASPASGSLSFTDNSGSPLQVFSGGVAGSSLPVAIGAGATSFFAVTAQDASSPLKTGWARLQTSGGSVSGVATFQLSDGAALKTLAGVFSVGPVTSSVIPVDNDPAQDRYTGFAIANPADVDINLQLATFDSDGTPRGEPVRPAALNPLPANGHVSIFLHELLPSALDLKGTMRITSDGGRPFVIVALEQVRGLLTAIPIVTVK